MVAIKTIADALDPMLQVQGNKQKLIFSENELNTSLELLNNLEPIGSISSSTSVNISNSRGSGYKITNLFGSTSSSLDGAGKLQLFRTDYTDDPGTLLAYFDQDGTTYFQHKIFTSDSIVINKTVYSKKLTLYDLGNNDYEFQGFSSRADGLIYTTNTGNNHIFVASTSVSSRTELFRINLTEVSSTAYISINKKNYAKKLVAYDNNNNAYEYQGLEAKSTGMAYHTDTGNNHIFIASTSSSAETELLRIGNAGIITSKIVQISNATSSTALTINNTSTGYSATINNSSIGTGLTVNNSSNGLGLIISNTSVGTACIINSTSSGDILLVNYGVSYTQALRIDNAGNIRIGTGAAGAAAGITMYQNGVVGLGRLTNTQANAITTEGGLLYNSTKKALQFHDGSGLSTLGSKFVILKHTSASGTGNGITAVVGWNIRKLNTIEFQNIQGFGLSFSNAVTLPAGVYLVRGRAKALTGASTGTVIHSFYNTTTSTDNLGDTVLANSAILDVHFTVVVTVTAASEIFQLRTRMGSLASAATAFGTDAGTGYDNCYAVVEIIQLQ